MSKRNKLNKLQNLIKKINKFSYPSLIVALMVFIGLFVLSIITTQESEEQPETISEPLIVRAIQFGSLEALEQAVGTIKNLNTITLVAQSNGPVENILVKEGQHVARGTMILQQSSAYGAGNASVLQREISQRNYDLANSSLSSTYQQLNLTKQQADAQRSNSKELRAISRSSIQETERIIYLSEDIIQNIENDIEVERSADNNLNAIQALSQQLLVYTNSLNQARSTLRSLRLQSDEEGAQADLAEIQYQITINSAELQKSTAELQKDIAGLNLQLAKIAENSTRIQAPISGRVEAVYPRVGEFLSAGSPAFIIRGESHLTLEVLLSGRISRLVDIDQPIQIVVPTTSTGDQLLSLPIVHLSDVPTNGSLFQLVSIIPDFYSALLYDGQTISVALPVAKSEQSRLIPLDSVFVTGIESFVFTVSDGIARSTPVVLGEIIGQNIEILQGIGYGEIVILDRRVVDGQRVNVEIISVYQSGE